MAGNREFELQGVNHLALVCKDMARTVDFYTNILGTPLIKTIDLPMCLGQHFFFDLGNGDALAFFWFPNAPAAQPGIASAGHLPTSGKSIASAHGSMNHVAINVPADKIDEYYEKLVAKGVKPTEIPESRQFRVSGERCGFAVNFCALDLFLRSRRDLSRIRGMDEEARPKSRRETRAGGRDGPQACTWARPPPVQRVSACERAFPSPA